MKVSIIFKSLREVGVYLRERESVKNVRREIGKWRRENERLSVYIEGEGKVKNIVKCL